MTEKITNIAIIGYGRMGKEIERIAIERGINVSSLIDPQLERNGNKFPEINEESLKNVDVAIDFTAPSVIMDNIKKVSSLGKNLVVGTTGWYDQMDDVKKTIKNSGTGFLWASNFSIGVNAFFKINEFAAKIFNKIEDYDVAGVEYHHDQKVDSPSGTAMTIAKILLDNIDRKKKITTDKVDRKIESDELQYASLRVGHVPGTHITIFDSPANTIELKQIARSRADWALGAVMAAEFINGKTGFFEIQDMMNEIIGE